MTQRKEWPKHRMVCGCWGCNGEWPCVVISRLNSSDFVAWSWGRLVFCINASVCAGRHTHQRQHRRWDQSEFPGNSEIMEFSTKESDRIAQWQQTSFPHNGIYWFEEMWSTFAWLTRRVSLTTTQMAKLSSAGIVCVLCRSRFGARGRNDAMIYVERPGIGRTARNRTMTRSKQRWTRVGR